MKYMETATSAIQYLAGKGVNTNKTLKAVLASTIDSKYWCQLINILLEAGADSNICSKPRQVKG